MHNLIYLYFFSLLLSGSLIEQDKNRWAAYYAEINPVEAANEWFLPFRVADRKDRKYLQIISTFGTARSSFYKGHIHTAIDVMPKIPAGSVDVYSMAKGVVCSIHLGQQFKTIVIKHKLVSGEIIYTSYKHLEGICVRTGQQVNENTKLARVINKKEAKEYKGNYDHLHLEIRKSFDDYGCGSWLTMTKSELDKYFFNPKEFIDKYIR